MISTSIRLKDETIDAIQEMADKENRKWNQMARLLMEEAIDKRKKK